MPEKYILKMFRICIEWYDWDYFVVSASKTLFYIKKSRFLNLYIAY